MKFSDNTISILKNFSTVEPSILIRPGNVLRTISRQRTIMAAAEVEEEFPVEAGIYDLPRFLATLSLFNGPNVEFEEKIAIISSERSRVSYTFAAPSMILSPPNKEIQMPAPEVNVDVKWEDIQSVIRAAGVLQLPEVAFVGEGGTIYMRAIDSRNTTADRFGVEIGETESRFTMIVKTENLKLIPTDYNIQLSSKGMAHFHSDKVRYWIAIESNNSNFSKE